MTLQLVAGGADTPVSPADLRPVPNADELRRQLGLPPTADSAAVAAAIRERRKPVPRSLESIRAGRVVAAGTHENKDGPTLHDTRSLAARIDADRERIQAAYKDGGTLPSGATVTVGSMARIRARHAAADRAATAAALRAQRGTA